MQLVHVKVTLENSLLKGVRLWLWLLSWLLDSGGLGWGLGHVRDGAGTVMSGAGSRGRGAQREGRARRGTDRALSAGAKLLGPIETLLVCS